MVIVSNGTNNSILDYILPNSSNTGYLTMSGAITAGTTVTATTALVAGTTTTGGTIGTSGGISYVSISPTTTTTS
jgi:hypothetical protein